MLISCLLQYFSSQKQFFCETSQQIGFGCVYRFYSKTHFPHPPSLYIFIPDIFLSFVSGDGRTHQVSRDVLTSGLRSLLDRHLVSTFQIRCEASWSTNEGRHVKSRGGLPVRRLIDNRSGYQGDCNADKRDHFHRKAFVTGYVIRRTAHYFHDINSLKMTVFWDVRPSLSVVR